MNTLHPGRGLSVYIKIMECSMLRKRRMRDSRLHNKGRVDMRVMVDDSPLLVYMLGPRHSSDS
jgi:hypothetical protein